MEYKEGDKVNLKIEYHTKLGYRVTINDQDDGLLFNSEVFQKLEDGMEVPGYIKNIHEDRKIDVTLRPQGFRNVIDKDVDKILQKLDTNNGTLKVSDKSSPDEIKKELHMSKKAFKKAIGKLYKQKRINITPTEISTIR